MSDRSYLFADTQIDHERERLETVQAVFDPSTRTYLERVGVDRGWTCLEVGAGVGSIMHWLCDRVGASGRVVAVDLDPRFIRETQRPNLEIRQLDITTTELEPNCYDLVHVRAVLMHVRQRDAAFQHIVRALKPGGWLLVEEPDFATTMPTEANTERAKCIERVFEATRKFNEQIGSDPYLGRKLPLILQQYNFQAIATEVNTALFSGQSLQAKIWYMALDSLGQKLIDADLCSGNDLEQFKDAIVNPQIWMLDYAIISAWGQKLS